MNIIEEKLTEDFLLRLDLEFDKLNDQESLLSKLDNETVAAHIAENLKEHYKFHIELLSNNGQMEIFDSNPTDEDTVVNKFSMVVYPIQIDYTSAGVFEIVRQASVSEIELSKDKATVFVPLSSEGVNHVDLDKTYQIVRNFIDTTHAAVQNVFLFLENNHSLIIDKLVKRSEMEVAPVVSSIVIPPNGIS